MNFLCPCNALFRNGGHIDGFVTVLNDGIHDFDFLLLDEDASGHKPDHVRFIDNLGDPCQV